MLSLRAMESFVFFLHSSRHRTTQLRRQDGLKAFTWSLVVLSGAMDDVGSPRSFTFFSFPCCFEDTRAGGTPFGSNQCTVAKSSKKNGHIRLATGKVDMKKEQRYVMAAQRKTLRCRRDHQFPITISLSVNVTTCRPSDHHLTTVANTGSGLGQPIQCPRRKSVTRSDTRCAIPVSRPLGKATVPKRASVLRVKQPTMAHASTPVTSWLAGLVQGVHLHTCALRTPRASLTNGTVPRACLVHIAHAWWRV